MKRTLVAVWALMAINLTTLGLTHAVIHSAPERNVRITPRADGILVSGTDAWGLSSILVFNDWKDLSAYFERRHLKLPALSYAEKNQAESITLESLSPTNPAYKVKWVSNGKPGILYTPDEASAQVFASYLRYQRLVPSQLGFSLAIRD